MRFVLTLLLAIQMLLVANPARAQEGVDLLLPPALVTPDAPFYRGARVKMGNEIMPVLEDKLPEGVLAQYQPEKNVVVVSNSSAASENAKGQALMDVVSTMSISDIETAAGQETDE